MLGDERSQDLPLNGRDVVALKARSSGVLAKESTVQPAAHVRSYFPEALYINPEIITDKDGRASIVIPIADSITTWRMAMIASTQHGALGTVDFEPEGLSGFLCRSRSARHAHPGRPGFDPGGHLQLLGLRAAR